MLFLQGCEKLGTCLLDCDVICKDKTCCVKGLRTPGLKLRRPRQKPLGSGDAYCPDIPHDEKGGLILTVPDSEDEEEDNTELVCCCQDNKVCPSNQPLFEFLTRSAAVKPDNFQKPYSQSTGVLLDDKTPIPYRPIFHPPPRRPVSMYSGLLSPGCQSLSPGIASKHAASADQLAVDYPVVNPTTNPVVNPVSENTTTRNTADTADDEERLLHVIRQLSENRREIRGAESQDILLTDDDIHSDSVAA